MQLSAYATRSLGSGRRVAKPMEQQKGQSSRNMCKQCESSMTRFQRRNIPNSYALAATLAAIWAEIFLMLENGGYMSPFSKFS